VGSDITFDISDPRAQAMIRDRTLQMVTVADTAQSTVRNAIAEGLAEGETVDDLRRRVQAWSKGIAKRHAENVARTEAGVCMNTSARNGYQDGGADGTEWLAARDERSRDWHAAMDGQTRKWDEKFTLNSPDGALECDGPGDPVLGPGDVCQCRCANAPWFADEASGGGAKPPKKPSADTEPVPVGTAE
jgi:SPP1 gp7 family putative phage head morphogenesis protein